MGGVRKDGWVRVEALTRDRAQCPPRPRTTAVGSERSERPLVPRRHRRLGVQGQRDRESRTVREGGVRGGRSLSAGSGGSCPLRAFDQRAVFGRSEPILSLQNKAFNAPGSGQAFVGTTCCDFRGVEQVPGASGRRVTPALGHIRLGDHPRSKRPAHHRG